MNIVKNIWWPFLTEISLVSWYSLFFFLPSHLVPIRLLQLSSPTVVAPVLHSPIPALGQIIVSQDWDGMKGAQANRE